MDPVIAAILIAAGIGLVALLVVLGIRDARERRYDSEPGSTTMPRERVEGEAHAVAARFARDDGQNF
ncbi:hypothetical protein D9V29_08920 [Mycetocola manganoxydans]|uniref:Uncharacterized protein n=1 Tax=Mycetocola manganoxydans TaxID=699879 RepID=A0A3L6ZV59_9MICO|nr:hypothetical protein [Mycetocola manganoxydans]RLP71451.1 hypothetical protein D9V29_08920 [Mycetocola manganoxydans]GHD46572.1 hypothetical protein GCM10008097_16690 [Mycetocola manganoxydans]